MKTTLSIISAALALGLIVTPASAEFPTIKYQFGNDLSATTYGPNQSDEYIDPEAGFTEEEGS